MCRTNSVLLSDVSVNGICIGVICLSKTWKVNYSISETGGVGTLGMYRSNISYTSV